MTTPARRAATFVLFFLLTAALMNSGCSNVSTSTSQSSDVSGDGGGAQGSNAVSQTGQRTRTEGVTMPMDRSIFLMDPTAAEASFLEARTSNAYVRSRTAQPTDHTVNQALIDSLLQQMTLAEKVGQMTQLELGMIVDKETFPETINEAKLHRVIQENHVGSILNVVSAAYPLDHWHEILRAIQEAARETRLGIPVLYGIDAMHGANYTQESVLFPQNQALAATWNLALAEKAAEITARDVRSSGIPWNFAPVLDVGRDPRWPRLYETAGEDPHLVTAMGLATVHGLQGDSLSTPQHVAACLKHFVGYSASRSGRDRTPAMIPETELRDVYLKPFQAAVDAGAASVMVNSGEVNGVPVHASRHLLTDVLRGEMGFDGVIVTDWLDIKKLVTLHRVAASEREATKMAIQAGIDMSMVPSDVSFIRHTISLVEDGEIAESRIDESVRRILRMKDKLGLFDDPLAGMGAKDVGSDEDRRMALQAAQESVTLLRNDNDLLPLSADQTVLVTGPTAHSMQSLNNGWTYTWQGGGRAQEMFHDGRPTLMEAIRAYVGEGNMTYVPGATLTSPVNTEAAVQAATQSDVAIVALGEGAYAETAGNLQDLSMPEAQVQLVERIADTGTPVVLVLIQGRPRTLGAANDRASAVVTAYNPGTEGGQAVMDVLYGRVNPSGHLPYTYPDRPTGWATYDHKPSERLGSDFEMTGAEPLYEFGHGLSYTTFEYGDLTVSADTMTAAALQSGDSLSVSVTVRNTGDRRGKDVVQLYVGDEVASVTPPVRRLRGFKKIDLAPGAEETVSFVLNRHDLSFTGRNGEPIVEPGVFRVQIDQHVQSFRVTGNTFVVRASYE